MRIGKQGEANDESDELRERRIRGQAKQTRRELFLAEMEQVVPWKSLMNLVDPFYPLAGRGRHPYNPYCPIRNVASSYPPTILIHGTLDTDVPHQESKKLAARFAEHGVKHEFLSLEGVGHGFAGAKLEEVEAAEAAAAAFLEANLR